MTKKSINPDTGVATITLEEMKELLAFHCREAAECLGPQYAPNEALMDLERHLERIKVYAKMLNRRWNQTTRGGDDVS